MLEPHWDQVRNQYIHGYPDFNFNAVENVYNLMGLVQKGWNTIEVMTEKYEENGDLMW